MRTYPKAFTLVCILLLAVYVSYKPLLAQPTKPFEHSATMENVPPAPLIVACSPDKPTVFTRETISVRAWTSSPTRESLRYTWLVSAGTIEGEGSEVKWNFTGVSPGTYKATVQVNNPKGVSSDCSMQVIVSFPPLKLKGGNRETGRSFLLPEQTETEGYGLYSYLLLGSPPNKNTRERYLSTIIEYLKFADISILEKYLQRYRDITLDAARRTLNITYLPLKEEPSQEMLRKLDSTKEKNFFSVAEWVLEKYDYERARVLLNNLPGVTRDGPYIISFLAPIGKNPLSPPYLYQDQSRVPPHLVSLWMKEFLIQASQENFWDEKTGRKLMLNLRTTIGILAIGLPEVKKALTEWINWKEKIS